MGRVEHRTWTTIDKSGWGPGPWQDEPDKEQFADEATAGLPCLLKRNRLGALCGYVGVPEGHPWFGKGYDDARAAGGGYPSVHGGLTYADFCQDGPEAQTICHVPAAGEADRVWWLGFDCAHHMDVSPGMASDGIGHTPSSFGETYRTVGYVKAECASLAAQAAEAAKAAA
jgi:hypothetical protein